MRELIVHGRIKTTEAKAKAVRSEIEKIVTKAKVQGEASAVHLQKYFTQDVMNKVIHDIAPLFKERPGGYTRIMRLGNRVKDNSSMVIIEWVEVVLPTQVVEEKGQSKSKNKKSTRKSSKKSTSKKSDTSTGELAIKGKEVKSAKAPIKNIKTTKVRKPSV